MRSLILLFDGFKSDVSKCGITIIHCQNQELGAIPTTQNAGSGSEVPVTLYDLIVDVQGG